ncbi:MULTISPECIES: ribonuclease HII [Arthrobacter]|uniref:Ribonuclease n=2 Tax=Arthrobacter TaxID=1663 RepID=A0ABU9KFC2_9MICC|nr:ribonuclease HII [Arthrobacter sp. YJM1]MDP5225581.1 ribonuclease HII [Arthrobacter sp. YJM1]
MAAPTLEFERSLAGPGVRFLACLDEVGRGALAGPVSVGLTVLDLASLEELPQVRDSKLLSPARREALAPVVKGWAPFSGVGHASAGEIDSLGIIEALALAAQRAWESVLDDGGTADAVLLDGKHNWLRRPEASLFDALRGGALTEARPEIRDLPVTMRIKADMDCQGVAAASILAKVERDAIMAELATAEPVFGWDVNKGYGTAAHKDAIRQLGPSVQHRRTWKLL